MVNNKINVKTIKKTVPPIFVKNTTVGVKLSDIILFDITLYIDVSIDNICFFETSLYKTNIKHIHATKTIYLKYFFVIFFTFST